MKLVLNGFAGAGTIEGGYDYHDGTRAVIGPSFSPVDQNARYRNPEPR